MKRFDLKKSHIPQALFLSKLLTSFKRALGLNGPASDLTSALQLTMKESEETFLTYDEIRRINALLLKVEKQRAEAIQFVREQYCRI